MKRFALIIFVAVVTVSLTGCFDYKVGTLLPKSIKTIYVPAFKNTTAEPNLEIKATNAVINKLNQDGTLQVVSSEQDADSVLKATIVAYKRKPVRYARAGNPDEYRLTVIVRATFTNLADEKVFWEDKRISGDYEFIVRGSLPSSERSALPDALDKLGENIVDEIVEGWD